MGAFSIIELDNYWLDTATTDIIAGRRHYVRILHLAATTMESEVDRALGLLLEAGTPFDYAAVRELAAPAPPQVPELALPRVVDLRVYDRLLAAGVR